MSFAGVRPALVAVVRLVVEGAAWEIGQERVEPRRSRVNPREVKRQVNNFGKKYPPTAANPADANPLWNQSL